MDAVPIISIQPLDDGSAAGLRHVAAEIGAAARDIGFFAVADHGLDQHVVDEMFAAGRSFFALPQVEKDRLSVEHSAFYLGYARMELERLDPSRPSDAKESFNFNRECAHDEHDVLTGTSMGGRNQWPALPGFRETMLRYFDRLTAVAAALHRAIAVDLGLDPDFFASRYERPMTAMRVLRYPPHPGEFDGTQYGAGPHTDYGSLTLLAQDGTEGLEVRRRDGTWVSVPPARDIFVCNIGDAMMRWTNDVYVSNQHRVVNRAGRERYSAAFFYEPNPDTMIACIPACATVDRPAKYPPIVFSEFLRSKLEATYT